MSSLARKTASAGARYKLNAVGEEFLEPLLGITELDSDDSSEETVGDDTNTDIEKQGPLERLKTIAVYCVLGAGVAFFTIAFVFAPQTLVFVAGSICVSNIPYSAYKEYHLSKIPTLRSLNNSLRTDSLRLAEDVAVLSAELDDLTPEADRARVVEGELKEIADQQHFNVNKLVELVKENQDIIDAMKENLRQRVIQDIIKLVVDCDKDNDMRINKVEAKMLALKIRIQLQEYGVEFDEARFYRVLSVNPSVPRIISIVQKLCPHYIQQMVDLQNEPSTENVQDELEDVDDEAEQMKEVYDMFTWQSDDDTGLSSGRRESLMAPTRRESGRNMMPRRTRLSDPSGRRTSASGDVLGNAPGRFST